MAVLGLRFCVRAFSSCGKWGPFFIAVCGPLIIVAFLVAEHRLQTRRLSNCGSRAQLLRGMWDLPRPGLEPVSSALAGRFSTTAPPGKPYTLYFLVLLSGECFQSYLSFTVSSALSNVLIRHDAFYFFLSMVILFFSVIHICFKSDHFNYQKEGRKEGRDFTIKKHDTIMK